MLLFIVDSQRDSGGTLEAIHDDMARHARLMRFVPSSCRAGSPYSLGANELSVDALPARSIKLQIKFVVGGRNGRISSIRHWTCDRRRVGDLVVQKDRLGMRPMHNTIVIYSIVQPAQTQSTKLVPNALAQDCALPLTDTAETAFPALARRRPAECKVSVRAKTNNRKITSWYMNRFAPMMELYNGNSRPHPRRFVNVYIKQDGRWQLVTHHSTPVTEKSP